MHSSRSSLVVLAWLGLGGCGVKATPALPTDSLFDEQGELVDSGDGAGSGSGGSDGGASSSNGSGGDDGGASGDGTADDGGGTADGGTGDGGGGDDGSASAGAIADFSLEDLNPSSLTYGQVVSPRDLLAQTSGWYFTHST